jgi:hypothetical protein
MTVSYVGATSAEATSVTLPSHQAGDLIVMWALRYGSTTPPLIPAGWNYRYLSQRAGGLASLGVAISCKTALSSAETSGTWTNATHLLAAVYRDDTDYLTLGCPNYRRATVTTLVYNPKLVATTVGNAEGSLGTAMSVSSGWVLGLILTHLNTAGIDTPPTGMTHRHMLTGATQGRLALADTDAAVSSFTSASVTVAATTEYITNVVEIVDTGTPKASAGGLFVAGGLTGGMRG